LVAWLIASRRESAAQQIYRHLGGRSPLLELTEQQAGELQAALGERCRVFVAMRYWHPLTAEAVKAVAEWQPERIVLLPLYPQYSTTTTASSLKAWQEAAESAGLRAVTTTVCCYPTEAGLIEAQAALLKEALGRAAERPRVLFSAHGLPKKIVDRGDPYPRHVEMTARAIVARLGGLEDWRVCYQSKVGPLEWIGPATVDEIRAAGAAGQSLVVVPIAFVSEHSETLVELDIDYAEVARQAGVPSYVRVAAVGTHPAFIAGLARLVARCLANAEGRHGARLCPPEVAACPLAGG
jgi:ferrochelatase